MSATRCQLRWAVRLALLSLFITGYYVRQFLIDNLWPAKQAPDECYCEGENFCFKGVDDDSRIVFGQKFECTEERINILKRFKLTQRFIDRQTIEFQHLIGHGHQPLFVVKGTQARFEEIRKMAMNIAKYYPFSKISIYNKDLNQTHTDEIRWWCNTEVAKFDKHKWPKAYLESKEHFDAMVVIDAYYKHDAFIMIDPSARFKVENAGIAISLLDYLFAIKNASLPTMTPLTVSTKTVGSLIHKEMYSYLPIPYQTTQMTAMSSKALFFIESKYTRTMIKYWFLCATTPGCITSVNSSCSGNLCPAYGENFWNAYNIAHLFGEEKAALTYRYGPRWSEITPELINNVNGVRSALLRKLRIDRVEFRNETRSKLLHLPCMGEKPWFGWLGYNFKES